MPKSARFGYRSSVQSGVYRIEFANPDDILLDAGSVVLEAGQLEGGCSGYHYLGHYEIENGNWFRAEAAITRGSSNGHRVLGVFDSEENDFDIILEGELGDQVIRGFVVRLDYPKISPRFRLTRRGP